VKEGASIAADNRGYVYSTTMAASFTKTHDQSKHWFIYATLI